MCQNCFFSQRKAKNHKLSHPMQEYCLATKSGEDIRDFSKVMRNKLKPKWYWRRHQSLGYLPVESLTEGPPIESRGSTPSNPTTSEIHSRMELYANRLADVERSQALTFGGDDGWSEDEHQAIASFAASLGSGAGTPAGTPKSPFQIVTAIDGMQKEELESVVKQLEEENR